MAFTRKDWKDSPDTSTPISAEALEDLETRLSDYTDDEVAAEAAARAAADTTLDGRVDALEAAPPAHTHDDRYYTETEVDEALALKANAASLAGKQSTSEKGQPDGYAPLDAEGLVPQANLPSVESGSATVLRYDGSDYPARPADDTPFTYLGPAGVEPTDMVEGDLWQAETGLLEITPEYFGAVGDGVTDDTDALQAAIDAAIAARGRVVLGARRYAFEHLDIDGSCAIVGTGAFGVYGTYASGVGNFTPAVSPFLTGCVLKCLTNAQAAAIDIVGESRHVDLRDFGLLWASPFASTGHGIRAHPGSAKNGLAGSRWDNIQVFGHDGDSYGFALQNMAQGTFTHLRAWGGGLLRFEQASGSDYGNATFIGCTGKLICAGTAHATHLLASGGGATRLGFIGCEWNAMDTAASWPTRSPFNTLTGPTSSQRLFLAAGGWLRGLSLVSPAFDAANSSAADPSLPGPHSHGGQFIDPGGFYPDIPMTPMLAPPATISNGLIPLAIEDTTTVTSATTVPATTIMTARLVDASGGAFAVTLPAASAAKGRTLTFKKIDASANAVTITRAGSDLIDGATTFVLDVQWETVTVLSNGTGWFVI